jgi:acetyl-CoA carboxylase carboxyl transferase subunit alpha
MTSGQRGFRGKATTAPGATGAPPSLDGAELLLSMVEARWASTNGGVRRMESQLKSQQELEKIEQQLARLEALPGQNEDVRRQIQELQARIHALRTEVTVNFDAWQKAELARHPQRPHTLDYIERVFTDWSEIHGDRGFGDDPALICGMARFHGQEVMVLGTEKGRDTKQRMYRNFGLPNPEGYRKALRVMKMAEKFSRPVITLVDVTGANPGLGAEERGQAEAIARNLREMVRLKVPILTIITGEGGSGGALAIAVADRVLMMENAVYSVISPEGCASIMWRDTSKKELAAQALRITAQDLSQLGCVDAIIPEPAGGAHADPDQAAQLLDAAIAQNLAELEKVPPAQLVVSRYNKFRNMAQFFRIQTS